MKKSILLFLAGLIGTIAIIISFIRLTLLVSLDRIYYYPFALIFIIMIVSTVVYFIRMRDELKGIPSEDEMTISLNRKAAADSFPYSLSMWVTILFLSLGSENAMIPISIGILGMAIIYGGFWLHYKFKGTIND